MNEPEALVADKIKERLATIDSMMYCNKFNGGVFPCWPVYKHLLIEKKLGELSAELLVPIVIKPWLNELPCKLCRLSRNTIEPNGAAHRHDRARHITMRTACGCRLAQTSPPIPARANSRRC